MCGKKNGETKKKKLRIEEMKDTEVESQVEEEEVEEPQTHKHYRLAIRVEDNSYNIAISVNEVDNAKCFAAQKQEVSFFFFFLRPRYFVHNPLGLGKTFSICVCVCCHVILFFFVFSLEAWHVCE